MEWLQCDHWSRFLTKKQFRFWVWDLKLKEFLESKPDFSDYARKMFQLIMEQKLEPDSLSTLVKEKMRVDIELKKVIIEIKKKQLLFTETFSNTPSYSANKAIKDGIETEKTYNAPEEIKENEIKDFIKNHLMTQKLLNSLRNEGNVTVNCGLCNYGFPNQVTKERAINFIEIHLFEQHKEEIEKLMLNV